MRPPKNVFYFISHIKDYEIEILKSIGFIKKSVISHFNTVSKNPKNIEEKQYCDVCQNNGWLLKSHHAKTTSELENIEYKRCLACCNPNKYPRP